MKCHTVQKMPLIMATISGLVRDFSRGSTKPRQTASSPVALKKQLLEKHDRDQADQCQAGFREPVGRDWLPAEEAADGDGSRIVANIPTNAKRAQPHTPRSRINEVRLLYAQAFANTSH